MDNLKLEDIKDWFVSYHTALLAKHYGFDMKCLSAYRNTDGEESLMGISVWKNGATHDNHEGFCAAPTYQQLIDWFRTKHSIEIHSSKQLEALKEYGGIVTYDDCEEYHSKTISESYYGALDGAFEEAFKLLPPVDEVSKWVSDTKHEPLTRTERSFAEFLFENKDKLLQIGGLDDIFKSVRTYLKNGNDEGKKE